MNSFHYYTPGTNECTVFNNYGRSLNRFQNSTNPYSSAQVNIFANLGAASDRSPSIYHGPGIHISSNIYVGRHHEYFGLPNTGQKFDCQFSQVCFIENGKISYLRGLWNAADMYNQVGWDIAGLKS